MGSGYDGKARPEASGDLDAPQPATRPPSSAGRAGKGRSVAQAYGDRPRGASPTPIAPGRRSLTEQIARPRLASRLDRAPHASPPSLASPATAMATSGVQAAALMSALGAREDATRLRFAHARAGAWGVARAQTAAAHADADAAIARVREQADRPCRALTEEAAAEHRRMATAAMSAALAIQILGTRTLAATLVADHGARVATHPRTEVEADAVTEGLRDARGVSEHAVHLAVASAFWELTTTAAQNGAAMEHAAAEARDRITGGLDELLAGVERARDAVIAQVERMTLAQLGRIDTAERDTVTALARLRHDALARISAHGGATDAVARLTGALDGALSQVGATLDEATAELGTAAEGHRASARTGYAAAETQLAARGWPELAQARAAWRTQADEFIASAIAAVSDVSAQCTQIEGPLVAHYTDVAEAAIADKRLTGPQILWKHVKRTLAGALEGLAIFLTVVLAFTAVLVFLLEAPVMAALAFAVAFIGMALLIGNFLQALSDRLDALSDQWGEWPWYGKLAGILLAIPAAASDAFGFTGGAEAATGRDSRTGRELTPDERITRAQATAGNLAVSALTGEAMKHLAPVESLPREEVPDRLAQHQQRGATIRTLGRDDATAANVYVAEYPDGRRVRISEAAPSKTPRPGAGDSAPTPEQAAAARTAADRAAKIQERRDGQLTALIEARKEPLIVDTVILGGGQSGTLAHATVRGASGAPPGAHVTSIPDVLNIAPEGSLFARHGDFPIGQRPGELRGPTETRQPGEFTSDHDVPVAASDYVRSLTMTGHESGMATFKATVTRVEVRPAGGWGEGVPAGAEHMPVRITAGGKTIYARSFISAGGLGTPRPVGTSGTPLAAHEVALGAAGRLVYAQESLTLPGGGRVVAVVGDGAAGAWACEAAIKSGAAKVYWIGRESSPGAVPAETRAALAQFGLTPTQIDTYVRAYNERNASTFRYVQTGQIELRTGLVDANVDPATNQVQVTLGDGSPPLSVDGIVAAVGQNLSVPAGMEAIEFRMVEVQYRGKPRVVALEAFDPVDGHALGIRIEGAQMSKAASLLPRNDRAAFLEAMQKQATDADVPADSRGVPGSIHQNNIDIPLANGAASQQGGMAK